MVQPTSSRPAGDTSRDGRPAPRRHEDAVGAKEHRHSRPASRAVYRRRRLVVLLGAVVVVALAVAFLALVWPGFARPAPEPAPTVTVTADAPTPTLEPVERTATTAFAQALPSTVLDLALTSDAATEAWTPAGALEAYELVYADGPGDDATTVTVVAGQWPTDAEAEVAATDLVGDAEPSSEGSVTVDDATVGRYAVVEGADGAATVTWRNGTAVLQATGPADLVVDVYEAFPL